MKIKDMLHRDRETYIIILGAMLGVLFTNVISEGRKLIGVDLLSEFIVDFIMIFIIISLLYWFIRQKNA